MTQADSVHSTPPINTSAIDDPQSPDKRPGEPQDAPLYIRTPVTPEEAFQAIGRLRKEARDEIERLLNFLDDTENHMELEPALGWPERVGQIGAVGTTDDRETEPEHAEDGADDEPSLGSHETPRGAVCYLQSVSFGEIDVEGEHDGREPGEDDEDGADSEPSLLGVTANGHPTDSDLEADVMDDQRGSTPARTLAAARERDRLRRFNVRRLDGGSVDLAALRGGPV